MGKIESSFRNMVLVLGGVSIFAAGMLGLVNNLTAEPIRKAELAKEESAVRKVLPDFNNNPVKEKYIIRSSEGDSLLCYPGEKDGKPVGVAIKSYSNNGFGGKIEIMVGLRPDGQIINYTVISHKETPGLGSRMEEWFRTKEGKRNVIGLNPGKDKMKVVKDGGDVDAITAATISSRAFLDAISRAYSSYMVSGKESESFSQSTETKGISSVEVEKEGSK